MVASRSEADRPCFRSSALECEGERAKGSADRAPTRYMFRLCEFRCGTGCQWLESVAGSLRCGRKDFSRLVANWLRNIRTMVASPAPKAPLPLRVPLTTPRTPPGAHSMAGRIHFVGPAKYRLRSAHCYGAVDLGSVRATYVARARSCRLGPGLWKCVRRC